MRLRILGTPPSYVVVRGEVPTHASPGVGLPRRLKEFSLETMRPILLPPSRFNQAGNESASGVDGAIAAVGQELAAAGPSAATQVQMASRSSRASGVQTTRTLPGQRLALARRAAKSASTAALSTPRPARTEARASSTLLRTKAS